MNELVIKIDRLVQVYFDRYPRELHKEATLEINKVQSFNSRGAGSGDEVVVDIKYDDEDAYCDNIINRYQNAKPGQVLSCTKEDLDEIAKFMRGVYA